MLEVSIEKSIDKKEMTEKEKPKEINSTTTSQNKMVRTDSSEQKIDKFLNTNNTSISMLPKSKADDVILR